MLTSNSGPLVELEAEILSWKERSPTEQREIVSWPSRRDWSLRLKTINVKGVRKRHA